MKVQPQAAWMGGAGRHSQPSSRWPTCRPQPPALAPIALKPNPETPCSLTPPLGSFWQPGGSPTPPPARLLKALSSAGSQAACWAPHPVSRWGSLPVLVPLILRLGAFSRQTGSIPECVEAEGGRPQEKNKVDPRPEGSRRPQGGDLGLWPASVFPGGGAASAQSPRPGRAVFGRQWWLRKPMRALPEDERKRAQEGGP